MTHKIIDPSAKQESLVDFSVFINQEICITPEIQRIIIDPANKKIEERKEKFRKSRMTKDEVRIIQKYHWRDNLSNLKISGRDGR